MAAIIAQITRANRERKKRNETRKKIKPGKCMNDIDPFDEAFDPKVSTFNFFREIKLQDFFSFHFAKYRL